MAQSYKKKLIEVAIPLDAINAASTREKSIRHGHPSTLHLWWARRPLAACRAVLFAQLVDDPSSHPDEFPTPEDQDAERKRLFAIIEDLVTWENSTNEEVLERARAEIRKSCGDELPPVYDPFSGGGSIPLEAQRLGLPAYGSDLNPVAVMIGKAMIEIPPKFKDQPPVHPGDKERQFYRNAEGLAEDVKYYGEWIREKAFERIGHLYPQVELSAEYGSGKATVIAWIWARTVPSPDPAFAGVPVPIASSFLLSSKKGKEAWIEPIVDKVARTISYRIRNGGTAEQIATARAGTKVGRGANFRCLLSGTAIIPDYVRAMGKAGAVGQALMAIVAKGHRGRAYIAPSSTDVRLAFSARPDWKPDQPMNQECRDLVSGRGYGFTDWSQLFTARQLVGLSTFSAVVHDARKRIERDALQDGLPEDQTPLCEAGKGARAYAEAVSVYLSFAISKIANLGSTATSWMSDREALRETFSRQAIPMVWDYAEANFFSNFGGSWSTPIDKIARTIAEFPSRGKGGIEQINAGEVVYQEGVVISSDPPYYDNIGYADLSDFFFCWLRPNLKTMYPEVFGTLTTPKAEELVAASYRHGGRKAAENFFLDGMSRAIANMSQQSSGDYPATVYYAFKQSEIRNDGVSSTGWVTFLRAVISAGFSVVGTWPVRTESPGRLIAKGTNALASSVVLVLRKKDEAAEVIGRAEFIRALKSELPAAIAALQIANIAPADIPQSAIGPGMGIFSRCTAVLEADDTAMSVRTALQLINAELDQFLNDLHGEFDAETRFTATWFEQHGNEAGDYGRAEDLARARGISVESVRHTGIVDSSAGKVHILLRDELDPEWDPLSGRQLTIWECCQHLVRALENDGEYAAAVVLTRIGGDKAESAKELAYYLYDVCSNKRNDANEATSYNGLIAVWPELTRLAATVDHTPTEQATMEL